ncbi:dTDP-4-dehydrorhamnose 3,5-epimerase [Halomonas sp. PR-M31]|uniref:dTDP-4-dehydrorhamnose 3,5-epimerase n=1 Tax=Halomonas sp. PR-M31 TaxID=1471202 RepID=UPI0009E5025C|nr:dTDP-4-dehydrorhamnose 3,5-epimerase [Halomonas sp. PR-M31]
MKAISTRLNDVLILEPQVHGDERGFFLESFNQRVFQEATGLGTTFVQDNHSRSRRGVLRGLHHQVRQPQGKLIRVIAGEILDVAVDIRHYSATYGQWTSARLSADNQRQLWVPPGFAHGFLVLSEFADVLYKTTDYYAPQHERAIRWDDPTLAIDWQQDAWQWSGGPVLSQKDQNAERFYSQAFYQNLLEENETVKKNDSRVSYAGSRS